MDCLELAVSPRHADERVEAVVGVDEVLKAVSLREDLACLRRADETKSEGTPHRRGNGCTQWSSAAEG
jgi:hypothetical protein